MRALAIIALAVAAVAASMSLRETATADPSGQGSRATCFVQPASGVPTARLAAITRGFNLSGWLDGVTPRHPDDGALAALRQRGFTHIRLPVNGDHLMEALSGRAQVAERLRELDDAIDRLLDLGFAVSLDLHPGGNFNRLHRADPSRGFELIRA